MGLVPTMGALHEGHISLVKACKKGNDIAVVSVFVNPTQFNDKEDLKRYPRTLDKDVALLEKNGCDYVFAPSVEEMYPEEDTRVFNFGYVESVMEGAKRPGHFNGVGQIVSKLFDIVRPHRAYFGMKDFQQIAVIKNMVKQLHYDLEIVSCPIIRETDGLAMSSRNTLLEPEYRKNAPHIHKVLEEATHLTSQMNVEELKKYKVPRTPSRERMWNNGRGDKIQHSCKNITNEKKTRCLTTKQDRSSNTGLIAFEDFCRYVTVKEACRLQTMPDDYCRIATVEQAYKGLGNGWTAEVIIHILNGAFKDIPRDEELIVLSMYDGIGTGRYCLDTMGFTNVKYFAYEIDKFAMKIAVRNFPDIIQCGDAFDVRKDYWKIGG